MKLHVIAVGHRMPGWIDAGYDDYARRMPPDMPLILNAIKPGHRTAGEDGARARQVEAERVLAALPAACVPVVLDERGTQATTRELAAWLQGWMTEGVSPAFVIGGADGLDASVKARAGKLLGLSKLTLPHALARVMLAEQLYRAVCIIKGHPYHRD
ncbi:MAG: 23S rRNA (pseudouridine(1915)-N(3))-methyltransferase RlmH [Thiobacillus sp. 63-78]|uniref:23S rRNA (pseudouridine(1915)-N(3))-methyltransferase RlmH n=1 Tax=Thiobacillus sp. 63-78 TaxID=1895859 RepID=UPI00086E3558|nr:23S rRNA (pseudouridine(1915)-N(3))-methyltransferase RlmH [Thiobacillus sp. 63-78]MBN8773988.1 23S rRNA (pseudouridine(1915)-N(3))-methyltransferase RlmH [Thiobacillus sp.]ODV14067.1 MAG: 23S rRNA (pseudouridine(1915)-N(3))-methyltransferase RlmH [Thiobacillus sp. SCN 64-317]OJZ15842.1 MAG: 23S rRNA (pseudouridine(1915)-N(3))-methyltransferase RlmH [Thiobacillus sp. 63-78]